MRISFEDPADLVNALTRKRIEIITAIREKPAAISELAERLRRPRGAVTRDVNALEAMGLVATHLEQNPGHGRKRVVRPVAERYELVSVL